MIYMMDTTTYLTLDLPADASNIAVIRRARKALGNFRNGSDRRNGRKNWYRSMLARHAWVRFEAGRMGWLS